MLKKYTPYIILLLAALALYYVKTHQRGTPSHQTERVTVKTDAGSTDEGFSRHPDSIIYTKHARCRMECRHISEDEVKQILAAGELKQEKIEQTEKGFSYPLDGKTSGDKMVRIVVSPRRNNLVVITVIDLDTDWPCGDCK